MSIIYKIRNVVNGKFYIGSTVSQRTRFQTHRRQLRKGNHHCPPLQRAWNKYGEDCFKFEVVAEVALADLRVVENRWLDEHHGQSHCYNVGRYADAPSMGKVLTEATKAAMSAAHKGKKHRLGLTNSPEHRAKQSASMRGIKKSPEHIEKIRQRMLGTSYAKGRVMSDEQKAAMANPVIEITQGMEFISTSAAADHFGLSRPNLIRILRGNGIVQRGPCKGLHFQRKHTLPASPE